MARMNVAGEELDELVQRIAETAKALIRGDVRGCIALAPHANDYTLMGPFGGEPTHGLRPVG